MGHPLGQSRGLLLPAGIPASALPLELRHQGTQPGSGPPDGPTLTLTFPPSGPACMLLPLLGWADGLVIPRLLPLPPVPSLYPQRSAPSTVNFPFFPSHFLASHPCLEGREVLSLQTEAPPLLHPLDPPHPTIGRPLSAAPV